MNFSNLRKCNACDVTLDLHDNFDRKANNQFEFQSVCKECSATIGKTSRQSSLSKRTNRYVYESHERELRYALEQKVEITCPVKLRKKHPSFTDHQIARMSRLNEKINAANDFLIEEQNSWLNPSERPAEGIEYREDLFGIPFGDVEYTVDRLEAEIREEQVDIDDQ